MVIRTDVENLPCDYRLGKHSCIHPRNRLGGCQASDCPELSDATEILKKYDNFYFIEKLGIHE